MIPYIATLLFTVGCALATTVTSIRKLAFIFAYLALVALAGLRFETGWDYEAYQYFYDVASDSSLYNTLAGNGAASDFGFEPGYTVLIWGLSQLGINYQLILAAITIGLIFYAAYRLAPSALPVFLIAYLWYGYFHNFSILRQGLAASIIFICFLIASWKYRIALYVVASLIHSSTIFLAPILYACFRFSSKKILLSTVIFAWLMSLVSGTGTLISLVPAAHEFERWLSLLEVVGITEKVGVSFILLEYTLISFVLIAVRNDSYAIRFASAILIYRLLTYGIFNDISIGWERTSAFADAMYAAAVAISLVAALENFVRQRVIYQASVVFVALSMALHVTVKYDRMLGSEARLIGERSHYERFIPYRSIFGE